MPGHIWDLSGHVSDVSETCLGHVLTYLGAITTRSQEPFRVQMQPTLVADRCIIEHGMRLINTVVSACAPSLFLDINKHHKSCFYLEISKMDSQ